MLNSKKIYSRTSPQSGFTLIELMITIAIVAILAAIAIPSYRQYMVKNAESQAQSKMKQLQTELEGWRANTLTYKGFTPKKVTSNGIISYAYDDTANTQIKIPDATNPRYTITLLADKTGTSSLSQDISSINTTGSAWRMLAVPSTNMKDYGAANIVLTSDGKSCKGSDLTITAECTETGVTKW